LVVREVVVERQRPVAELRSHFQQLPPAFLLRRHEENLKDGGVGKNLNKNNNFTIGHDGSSLGGGVMKVIAATGNENEKKAGENGTGVFL
jgi:hypothetical protein